MVLVLVLDKKYFNNILACIGFFPIQVFFNSVFTVGSGSKLFQPPLALPERVGKGEAEEIGLLNKLHIKNNLSISVKSQYLFNSQ